MDNRTKLLIRLEVIWWLITGIILLGVLFPIYKTLGEIKYPFWVSNCVFIVIFITFSRYIFLTKHTILAYRQWWKVVVAIICIPLFIYLLDEFSYFRRIADEVGLEELFDHLSLKGQISMANYVKSEMLFFGAGSIICSVIMPIRMLISFWRTYNRGTV